MVRLFHLDRSETKKILCKIRDLEDTQSPFRFDESPVCAQVSVVIYPPTHWIEGAIEIVKIAEEKFFNVEMRSESYWCEIIVNKKHIEEMLKTDLNTIDFSNCKPPLTI